jgi:arsenate reductase
MITIYHNPRCGKSRDGLAFIQSLDVEYEIVKYLETPLSNKKLKEIIKKLKLKPIELIRIKEPIWTAHFKGKNLTDEQIIQAMVEYPILIERPIVVYGEQAIVARPHERIKDIL